LRDNELRKAFLMPWWWGYPSVPCRCQVATRNRPKNAPGGGEKETGNRRRSPYRHERATWRSLDSWGRSPREVPDVVVGLLR